MIEIQKITSKKDIFTFQAPSSKAHTLRSIILSALADGISEIYNPLWGEDQIALLDCLEKLGIPIVKEDQRLIITGNRGRFKPRNTTLFTNESGVSMNFLISLASLCQEPVVLTGKPGLLKRPVTYLIDALEKLGCKFEYLENKGYPPIRVMSDKINGGSTELRGDKSSQYFSSIAISAPFAEKEVTIQCLGDMVEKPYFDITADMMKKFGVNLVNEDYKTIKIPNTIQYKSTNIDIEGDFSSASYFFIGAAIAKRKITVTGLYRDSLQGDKFILNILEKMGCSITYNKSDIMMEGCDLKPVEVDMSNTPDLVPGVAILAANATGKSVLQNVGHLKFKECDRIEAISKGLELMGVKSIFENNHLVIEGTKRIRGAVIDSFNDHRIAMSFGIAGIITGNQFINDEKCVSKSFPDFWDKIEIFYH
jgi:3-phosphoshikimate 1-carboxyvinyltransferase